MAPIKQVEPDATSVLVVTFRRRPSSEPDMREDGTIDWRGGMPLPGDWSMVNGTWTCRDIDSPSVQVIARDPRVLSIKYADLR